MQHAVYSIIGIVGGAIATAFGGFDVGLQVLVTFMALDYATGLVVAGVFHKSGKSETGRLESRAGFKGLCRKGMELILVLVGACLDRYTGNSFVRDAVVMAFIANEALSLLENAVLMGLPVPKVLTRVLEVMQKKADREDEEVKGHDVS